MEGPGTVVQLPPDPAGSDATAKRNEEHSTDSILPAVDLKDPIQKDVNEARQANIHKRNASREKRKLELLMEARKARIDWILDGVNEDAKDPKEVLNGKKNPLRELQACSSNGVSCAPDIVEALFSSKLDGDDADEIFTASKIASEVKRILERERLAWEHVSSSTQPDLHPPGKDRLSHEETITNDDTSSLDLPIVPQTQSYNTFLHILCQPDAADVVFSIQTFCRTIEEASKVILSVQEDEKQKNKQEKIGEQMIILQQKQQNSLNSEKSTVNGEAATGGSSHVTQSSQTAPTQPQNHTESLAKAVRGFIKTTFRDIQKHDAFKVFPQTEQDESDTMNEELMACVETFVFTKCEESIYRVLGAELGGGDELEPNQSKSSSNKMSVERSEAELEEKMKLLQFVSPEHLEIQCLKLAPDNTIDLSSSIDHLQSIRHQSSPRQKLRSILLAYQKINASLNAVLNNQKGDSRLPTSPSADDVLPTLILATLRAQPTKIIADLRFIELFAMVSLLRGEAGYAYTNLCGAVKFLRKLDMEGHAAEVSLGEEGSHLLISPDEFRAGIEHSKQTMKLVEDCISRKEGIQEYDVIVDQDTADKACTISDGLNQAFLETKISGRDIRQARINGETIDIDWALKKQKDIIWQHCEVNTESFDPSSTSVCNTNLLPEEPPLPPNFDRSYSYLATRPDDIRMSDLPKLLNEYRLLVHATESLLSERSAWREAERRRQTQMERTKLERDYNEVIGQAYNVDAENGHRSNC